MSNKDSAPSGLFTNNANSPTPGNMKPIAIIVAFLLGNLVSFAQMLPKEIGSLGGGYNQEIIGIITRDAKPLLISRVAHGDIALLAIEGSSRAVVETYNVYQPAFSSNPCTAMLAIKGGQAIITNLVAGTSSSLGIRAEKQVPYIRDISAKFVSPSGRIIATRSAVGGNGYPGFDEMCQVVDAQSGNILNESISYVRLNEYTLNGWTYYREYSPSGNSYVELSGGNGGTDIKIVDSVTKSDVVVFFARDFYGAKAIFGRNGSTVILAGTREFRSEVDIQHWRDGSTGLETQGPSKLRVDAIEVWDLKSQQRVGSAVGNNQGENAAGISELFGGYYAVTSGNEISFFDTNTKRLSNRLSISDHNGVTSFSQDGKFLLAGGKIYELTVTSLEKHQF